MHAVASGDHASPSFTNVAHARGGRGGGHAKSKTWVNGQSIHSNTPSPAPEGRWERGRGSRGVRRGGRGGFEGSVRHSRTTSANVTEDEDEAEVAHDEAAGARLARFKDSPSLSNGTTKTWEQLVKEREEERARAIREGKMDDPNKRKRLDELITIAGTCQDMCPEFERYRRERENNLDRWECILDADGKPTKKVDHQRAVKIYERGQGDKIIPSDLRPAPVLKRTLDYLFYDLIPRGGFEGTQAFVRDRSRAVRNDFTIQSDHGPVAVECHERCARFHVLSLHLLYGHANFDRALEIQQLMNSLLSLKEFYDDQRGKFESESELEMRIYHRLGLIRDQHERNDRPPPHIAADPAFQLVTRFRSEVQAASSPITKTSQLRVSEQAMATFGELLGILQERKNQVMMFLVACFLEHIFGPETIDDFEGIRGDLSIQDIIDGNSAAFGNDGGAEGGENGYVDEEMVDEVGTNSGAERIDDLDAFIDEDFDNMSSGAQESNVSISVPPSSANSSFVQPSGALSGITTSRSASGAFGGLASAPSGGQSVFGQIVSSSSMPNVFSNKGPSIFGKSTSAFGASISGSNVFGGPVFGASQSNTNTISPSPSKQTHSQLSVPSFVPSSSSPVFTDGKDSKGKGRLSDAAPLSSAGEEDNLPPSELVTTPQKPSPFTPSKNRTILNPEAPFEPFKASLSMPSLPTNSRAFLTPLRTDSHSLLQNAVDPNRRALPSSIMSPGLTFPSPSPRGSPLFINTNSSPSKLAPEVPKEQAVDSPLGPPPLHRGNIISLPGTPTGSFTSAFPLAGPSTPSTPYHFPGLQVNVSTTTTNAPYAYAISPNTLLPRTSDSVTPFQSFSSFSPVANGKGKEVETRSQATFIDKEELEAQAKKFCMHGLVVESSWRRWRSKTSEALAWKEACRRSEEYKHKLLQQSPSNSLNRSPLPSSTSNDVLVSLPSSGSFKRQRSTSSLQSDSGHNRRRKRLSNGVVEMRTDEELTERLMKNKEQHERRWAKGSFVRAIRERIQEQTSVLPNDWVIWLCLNSDDEKTAIWLQQKFDVPDSGQWLSEYVCMISISQTPSAEVFPGVLVFECTALQEVSDDIERKYRVLDDLIRLRESVKAFKETNHYLPSVVLICWDAIGVHEDITRTIESHIEDGKLGAYSTVILSSDDPDAAFIEGIHSLDFDTQGELVEFLSLPDIFDSLGTQVHDTLEIWLEACASDDVFHWVLFSHVFVHYIEVLNALIRIAYDLWYPERQKRVPSFVALSFPTERNENSVPAVIRSWLSSTASDSALLDYVSVLDFSQAAESLAFFDHLIQLALTLVAGNASTTKAIPKASLLRTSSDFEHTLEVIQAQIRGISASLPQRSSRRSFHSQEHVSDITGIDDSVSRQTSPVAPNRLPILSNGGGSQPCIVLTTSSPPPSEEIANGSYEAPSSPTLSNAPSVASTTTQVTLQMLRALSRDVLNTYGTADKSKRRSRPSL